MLYSRITDLNFLAVLSLQFVLRGPALDIFDTAVQDCPAHLMYCSGRTGAAALYEKYTSKDLLVLNAAGSKYEAWFFDQTQDPGKQLRALEKILKVCESLDIGESMNKLSLRVFTMLQACKLYSPVVIEISGKMNKSTDAITYIQYDAVKARVVTFYEGVVYTEIQTLPENTLKELQRASRNWRNIPQEPAAISINQVQDQNLAMLENIAALTKTVQEMNFGNNSASRETKTRCSICNMVHGKECRFKAADACTTDACKGHYMFGRRHIVGCPHFKPDRKIGKWCFICGQPGVLATEHHQKCQSDWKSFQSTMETYAAGNRATLNLFTPASLLEIQAVTYNISSFSGDISSLEYAHTDYPVNVHTCTHLVVDKGAAVSVVYNQEVCIPGTFVKKQTEFNSASATGDASMISDGYGLMNVFVLNLQNPSEHVRLVFPVFVFESPDSFKRTTALISEGMFDRYGYEFSSRLNKLISPCGKYEFPLKKVIIESLHSCKWLLDTVPSSTLTVTKFRDAPILDITKLPQPGINELANMEKITITITTPYSFGSSTSHEYVPFTVEDAIQSIGIRMNTFMLKDPADWKFECLDEVFRDELKTKRIDVPSISMYNSPSLDNMHSCFTMGYTTTNRVEDNVSDLLNQFFYGCPPFDEQSLTTHFELINKVLMLGQDSACVIVIPSWKTASWYEYTLDYEILKIIPTGTEDVFSAQDIIGLTPEGVTFTETGRVSRKNLMGSRSPVQGPQYSTPCHRHFKFTLSIRTPASGQALLYYPKHPRIESAFQAHNKRSQDKNLLQNMLHGERKLDLCQKTEPEHAISDWS